MSVELSSTSYLVYLLYITVGKAKQLHLQGRKLLSLKPSRFSTKVSVKILAFTFICIYSLIISTLGFTAQQTVHY